MSSKPDSLALEFDILSAGTDKGANKLFLALRGATDFKIQFERNDEDGPITLDDALGTLHGTIGVYLDFKDIPLNDRRIFIKDNDQVPLPENSTWQHHQRLRCAIA
jgi:hypothetical protein